MSGIISELSNSIIFWANVLVSRRAHSMSLKIIPEAISIRTSGVVSNKNVVWMGDPEAGWCLICVKKTPRSLGLDNKVVLNVIIGLNGILDEYSVALDFVSNIFLKSKVVSSMKSKSSVVTLMGTKTLCIRVVDGTDHMEMNSVSSNLKGLSNISQLDV